MNTREFEALNEVIESLYCSAAEGKPWNVARMRDFLGTDFCHVLYMSDGGIILNGFSAGMSDGDRRHYLDAWAEHDAIGPILFAHTTGAATPNEALMSRGELEQTTVFEGFYEPTGVIHFAVGYLPAGDGINCAISVQNDRRGGPIRPITLKYIDLLTPHLQRAMRFSRQLEALHDQREAMDRLLVQWGLALIRCDACGRIRSWHGDAEAVLEKFRALLRCPGGRLEVKDADAAKRLQALLTDPLHGPSCVGPTMYLHHPATGAGLELTILPTSEDMDGSAGDDRMVLIRDANRTATVDRHYLRRRFHLTPAEADVMGHLLLGKSLLAIAETRGSTLETIRSYIKGLRKKLRCSSQAQLVSTGWRGIGFLPQPQIKGR